MLLDVFRVIINHLFKKSFKKKKVINFWQLFTFLIKVVLKLF